MMRKYVTGVDWALSLQVTMKVKEGEMESLKSNVEELDQLVRRNSEVVSPPD